MVWNGPGCVYFRASATDIRARDLGRGWLSPPVGSRAFRRGVAYPLDPCLACQGTKRGLVDERTNGRAIGLILTLTLISARIPTTYLPQLA